ncbi:MAG: helix-turn-helix domain-containing protein [Lyngbya sp. HA4199-MV5]|jgi:transposase|nr:helix-turn-helix domain-containing protein [Lyngbya sp. HA4199-MV5]
MAGVYKLKITETEADLKQRLRTQKTASDKERLQLLYLLQTKQATTIQSAATLLGRHRVTVQEWLRLYRQGGLEALLAHKPRTGRQQSIPQWAQEALNKRLHQPEGFESYGAICQWLESQLGISAPYKTVHQLVHYRLKASPKVARPVSVANTDARVEAYKKTRREPRAVSLVRRHRAGTARASALLLRG